MKNITKHLLGKPLSAPLANQTRRKGFEKTNCFHCSEPIEKRNRDFIQVVKRSEKAFADCPSICFHSNCWLEAAGEDFEIK